MKISGEELIAKMWETLFEKGIGGLLRPWQIKREGRAQLQLRRAEILALAETERLVEDVRAGRKTIGSLKALTNSDNILTDSGITTNSYPNLTPLEIAANNSLADSLRSEVNVAKAIAAAEEELRDDTNPVPSEKIDDDWLYRWREYAGKFSAEEAQSIWGKVLAGELKTPGTFAFRTLDFIRNLSTQEATKIAALAPFVLNDLIAREHDDILNRAGISFFDLLELQTLGIVHGTEALGLAAEYDSDQKDTYIKALRCHNRVLMVMSENRDNKLTIGNYGITALGRQLLSLGKFKANEEYLNAVGLKIKSRGYKVDIADYQQVSENTIRVFNRVAL